MVNEISDPEDHQEESKQNQKSSKSSFNFSLPPHFFVICIFEIEHRREKETQLYKILFKKKTKFYERRCSGSQDRQHITDTRNDKSSSQTSSRDS